MSHYQVQPQGEQGRRRSPVTPAQRIVGLVLLVPALIVLLTQQVIPTVSTLVMSVTDGGIGSGFAGLDNFAQIPSEFYVAIVKTAGLGLLIGAMGVVVGILLGMLLRRAPVGWRRVGLAVLGAGLVTYGPASITYVQFYTGASETVLLARSLVALLPLFILIGALSAALSRSGALLLAIGAVTSVGGAALALQSDLGQFAMNVPGMHIQEFLPIALGVSAATSVLLGLLLAALGVGAALLLLASRPRFDLSAAGPASAGVGADPRQQAVPGPPAPGYAPGPHAPAPGYAPGPHAPAPGYAGGPGAPTPAGGASAGVGVLAVLASAAVVTVLVFLALPWLADIGVGADAVEGAGAEARSATWDTAARRALEVALTALVTGTAAIGIGYLRPFGRHSLRVLLVVSPWFFVGLLPLVTAIFTGWSADAVTPPYAGLTPQMLTVPLLFVLAYIADGVRSARDAGRPVKVGATIALVVLAVGAVAVARSQQLLWDMMFLFTDASNSAVQMLQMLLSRTFGEVMPLGLLTPPALMATGAMVFAAAAAMVPGGYLVRAGRHPRPGPPQPGQPAQAYPGQPVQQPDSGQPVQAYPGQPVQQPYPGRPVQQDTSWGPSPDDGRYGPGPPRQQP